MSDLNFTSLEEALKKLREPGMSVPFTLATGYPIGTEKVINGKRYRLVDAGPGKAKVMRVRAGGKLEEI